MILFLVVFVLSLLSAGLCTIRIFRGPTFPDRVISFELLSFVGIGAMGVIATATNEPVYLDIILIWSLVSFLGTVGFARYLTTPSSGPSLMPPLEPGTTQSKKEQSA
jgi:multicomponent Na+:H+ antiporter subunit F